MPRIPKLHKNASLELSVLKEVTLLKARVNAKRDTTAQLILSR
jgi:hypothetical protein